MHFVRGNRKLCHLITRRPLPSSGPAGRTSAAKKKAPMKSGSMSQAAHQSASSSSAGESHGMSKTRSAQAQQEGQEVGLQSVDTVSQDQMMSMQALLSSTFNLPENSGPLSVLPEQEALSGRSVLSPSVARADVFSNVASANVPSPWNDLQANQARHYDLRSQSPKHEERKLGDTVARETLGTWDQTSDHPPVDASEIRDEIISTFIDRDPKEERSKRAARRRSND